MQQKKNRVIPKIIIIGGKGAAVNLADHMIEAITRFNAPLELLGYSIDDLSLGSHINDLPVLCKICELDEKYGQYKDIRYFYSLYKPSCMEERVRLLESLNLPKDKFINFIHPSAYVAPSARIGTGNVILAHAIVNSNARLGDFNTINGNVLYGHDTQMGNHNIVAGCAAISSEIVIGNGNFIGLNSTLKDRIKVGDFAIIGMGSVVLNDVDSHTCVVGSPARLLSK